MNTEKKEAYVQPELVKHELLRDITASVSGSNGCTPGKDCKPD
jgi:hypothetical protein